MSTATPGSLSERHERFTPIVAQVTEVESTVGSASPMTLWLSTDELQEGLAHELLPHAAGEGRIVFPVLRRVTGSERRGIEMTEQHREIGRLTDRLEQVRGELSQGRPHAEEDLVEVLDLLRAALDEHFKAEEEACFTVLKQELSSEEAAEVCAAMERATDAFRRAYE
jgi:iron-sulfur cluster repair protein YtfE (RIC family)